MNAEESRELAQLLALHLLQLAGDSLEDYLRRTYRLSTIKGLSTDVVYAVEVEGGNFDTGDLSSVPVRWWEMTTKSCRPISFVNMVPYNQASDAGLLWPHPIIAYHADLPFVLSKEGIGVARSSKGDEEVLLYFRILSVVKENDSFDIVKEKRGWLFKR